MVTTVKKFHKKRKIYNLPSYTLRKSINKMNSTNPDLKLNPDSSFCL